MGGVARGGSMRTQHARTRVVDVVDEDAAGPATRALGDGAARDQEEGSGLEFGWWLVVGVV